MKRLFSNLVRSRRVKLLLWSLMGLTLPLAWWVWPYIRSPMVIRIDEETTFLTQPVAANGYVDFTDEWNRCLRRGVDSEAGLDVDAVAAAGTLFELSAGTPDEQLRMENLIDVIRQQSGVIRLPPMSDDSVWLDRNWPALRRFDGRDQWQRQLATAMSGWTLDAIKLRDKELCIERLDAMVDVLIYLRRTVILSSFYGLQPLSDETIKMVLTVLAVDAVPREDVWRIVRQIPDISEADLINEFRICRLSSLTYRFAQHAGEFNWLDDRPTAPLWARIYMRASNCRILANLDWNDFLAHTNKLHDHAQSDVSRFVAGEIPLSEFSWLCRPDSPAIRYRSLGRSSVADDCRVFVAWKIYADRRWLCEITEGWYASQRLLTFLTCTMTLLDHAEDGSFPERIDQLALDSPSLGNLLKHHLYYERSEDSVQLSLSQTGDPGASPQWTCQWTRDKHNSSWKFRAFH